MFKVVVDKECGCFRRSTLRNDREFQDKDKALEESLEMVDVMNNEFCGKHEFAMSHDDKTFTISMKEAEQSSGCCGGGCGTH
jgi:hypothetical protein